MIYSYNSPIDLFQHVLFTTIDFNLDKHKE